MTERKDEEEARLTSIQGCFPTGSLCSYHREVEASKVREMIELLEDDRWYQVWMKESHRQLKHSVKVGLVAAPGKGGDGVGEEGSIGGRR